MGHARFIYWHPRDNRTFHGLGTKSVDALDREPNVNIWRCCRHSIGKDQLSLGAVRRMLHCGFSLRSQLTPATSER